MTSMTLHFNGVGSHSRVFEALGSMLSRNALNPADVTIVSLIIGERGREGGREGGRERERERERERVSFSVIQVLC